MFNIKDNIQIISYKHNKKLHRIWDTGMLIEEGKNYLVIANDKTQVLESSGKIWFTKEPAIVFFYKEYWFNIIAMFKKDGIHYYCNIATPYLVDDEGVKYIDYDLDLKVFPDGRKKVLDVIEFKHNSKLMKYSEEVNEIIKSQMKVLYKLAEEKEGPFNKQIAMHYYDLFTKLKKD